MKPFRNNGFTLLEVMIALAILAGGLTILLSASAANVAKTQRAQAMAVAADLARAKMYDLEEELLEKMTEGGGFDELDQEEEGEFDEEGWPTYSWKATINKIEFPSLEALSAGAAVGEEQEGEEDQGPESALGGGMLGGMLGMAGGDGAAGASLIASQYEIFRNVFERAIRKVTLTVSWKVGTQKQELVVDCFFSDPAAVNRVVPFLGGDGGTPTEDPPR